VKPEPVIASELIVTTAVPLAVSVTDLVAIVPTVTLPNDNDDVLALSAGVEAFSCSDTVREELPVEAVITAVCAVVTEVTFTVNDALDAVAGTVAEPGTVTEPLLLANPTLTPPVGAAPDRVTVHESVSAPVIEVFPQVTELTVGTMAAPVPLILTETAGALLEMFNCPLTAPAVVGSNETVKVAD
jgi:hypothetical protein